MIMEALYETGFTTLDEANSYLFGEVSASMWNPEIAKTISGTWRVDPVDAKKLIGTSGLATTQLETGGAIVRNWNIYHVESIQDDNTIILSDEIQIPEDSRLYAYTASQTLNYESFIPKRTAALITAYREILRFCSLPDSPDSMTEGRIIEAQILLALERFMIPQDVHSKNQSSGIKSWSSGKLSYQYSDTKGSNFPEHIKALLSGFIRKTIPKLNAGLERVD